MSLYSTLHQLHSVSSTHSTLPSATAYNTQLGNSPPVRATGHCFTGQGADDLQDMLIVSVAYNLNQLKYLVDMYFNTVLASMSGGVNITLALPTAITKTTD